VLLQDIVTNVTIFPFLYGLHIPLPRDPITCTAALTFSSISLYYSDSSRLIPFSSPIMLDSYRLTVTLTFPQV